MVTAVLESLSAPAGAEDTRSREQRYHDALTEAMRRLVASGLLPERAGQPVKVWAHVSLAELRALDDGSVLQDQWIGEMAARWAARRAAASEGGSDGGAWIDGKAARAMACDAIIAPVVTGDVDPGMLDDLVRLCVQLDRLDHGADRADPAGDSQADPEPEASPSREALRKAIIGKAVDLLSGPGGLASFLRMNQLGARLAGPEPAAGYRVRRDDPAWDPERCHPEGPALPVARRLPPARRGLPSAPRQAQGSRRPYQPHGMRPPVQLPPPDCHPPLGLDAGAEPGRDHHGVEPGSDQGAAQSRASGPRRVINPAQRYPVAESNARANRLSSSPASCPGVNQARSLSSSSRTAEEPSMIAASYTAVT